jgi:hypothetical protein
MIQRVLSVGVIAGGLVLGGCSDGVTTTGPESSFFRAAIQGALSTKFEGSGQFTAMEARQTPQGVTIPASFALFSEGRGNSANQTFQLHRQGSSDVPQPGRYTLGGGDADFQATFMISSPRGESLDGYAAYEGSLEITSSSPEAIEGTFHLSGFRIIRRTPDGGVERMIHRTPESPTIEVTGSFRAESRMSQGGRR